MNWEAHATAMADTLVVPANASKIQHPILTNPSDNNQQRLTLLPKNKFTHDGAATRVSRATNCYGQSPFPKLEDFVNNTLGSRKGIQGSISTWSLGTHQPIPRTVTFNIKNNRWCEHISRPHKSNGIFWVVQLIDRVCWQSWYVACTESLLYVWCVAILLCREF